MVLKYRYLALAFVIGLILRLFLLDKFPVSISWDEAAIGYNAFSIAKAGVDEYGKHMPILFQSFNDFKLPGYIYALSIFIKLFGFSDFVVRFPSALAGGLSVILMYFIGKKIFSEKVGIISSFVFAISPWSLQFSRGAFEANLALFIFLLGLFFLIYGLENRRVAFFSLPILFSSVYFYYSERLLVPLVVVFFFYLFRKKILKNLQTYVLSFVFGIIICLPIIIQILTPSGFQRIGQVSIFSDSSIPTGYLLAREKNNFPLSNIILNRRVPVVYATFKNYFSHFSPGFLFFGDDPNPRQRPGFHGILYLFEIPILLLGLYLLLRQKGASRNFILIWLLIAPLPGALSTESPHALRSLLLLPPLILIISIGIDFLIANSIKKTLFLVLIYFVSVLNYLSVYYFVYPIENSLSWGYGYKELFQSLRKEENNYKRVIVSGYYWKPRIYYEYYRRTIPSKIGKTSSYESLGKYIFGTTSWDWGRDFTEKDLSSVANNKTLVALAPPEAENPQIKNRLKRLFEIKDYSGRKTVFIVGEWK